ncbi:MAG: PilZ domain-containing protein [Gammaproteobacteria bacterium]
MTEDKRATYRVSVKPKSGLEATVHVADIHWNAVLGNISAEGVFLRLEPNAPVDLELNSSVDVEIASDGEALLLHGIVRSRRDRGYGIYFPKRFGEGSTNPLDQLGQIWAELQRDDLSTRVLRRLE